MLRLKQFGLLILILAVASLTAWQLMDDPSQKTEVLPAQATMLTLNLGTEPPTLDPALAVDLTSGTVIDQLYQGLTSFDEQATVVPAVASSWEVSTDARRYLFHLKSDARWSDGQAVTAQQFVAAWKRILTPETAAQYANFLFPIKGAKAFYDRKDLNFNHVGVQALSEKLLAVTLEKPLSFLPSLMALPVALPLRSDLLAKYGKQFTEPPHLIGNGPYQLAAWKHEDFIRLTPNPYYLKTTGSAPERPSILFRMIPDANTSTLLFNNKQLDLLESGTSISAFDYATYAKHPNAHQAPVGMIQYLGFNTKKAPFNQVSARKAFCQCLQRDYFPQLLKSGQTPLKSFIEPHLPFYNPTVGLAESVQQSKSHWQHYLSLSGGTSPPITLGFRNGYDTRKQAEILQFFWKQGLGVTVQLQNADWKVYLQRLKTDTPPLFLLTWYMDYPDADSFLSLFHSSNGNNHTQWQSARFDSLIEKASQTLETVARQQYYNQAQHILLEEDVAICPLFTLKKLWVTQPWVKGITFNSLNQLMLDKASVSKRP
jgi:oligopeptide transport system substrate-binding protein